MASNARYTNDCCRENYFNWFRHWPKIDTIFSEFSGVLGLYSLPWKCYYGSMVCLQWLFEYFQSKKMGKSTLKTTINYKKKLIIFLSPHKSSHLCGFFKFCWMHLLPYFSCWLRIASLMLMFQIFIQRKCNNCLRTIFSVFLFWFFSQCFFWLSPMWNEF